MPYSQLLTFQADGATLLQLVAPCGTRRLSPATILSTVGFHQRLDLGLHLRAARDCHLPAAGVFLVARGFATGTGRSHFPETPFLASVREPHISFPIRPVSLLQPGQDCSVRPCAHRILGFKWKYDSSRPAARRSGAGRGTPCVAPHRCFRNWPGDVRSKENRHSVSSRLELSPRGRR